jgi:hypothetical protein
MSEDKLAATSAALLGVVNNEASVAKIKQLLVAVVTLAQVVDQLEAIGPEPEGSPDEHSVRRMVLFRAMERLVKRCFVQGIAICGGAIAAIADLEARATALANHNTARAN